MAYVVISPDQFRYLEDACKSNKTITDFQETGNYTGVITTHDVTIDYTYDPLKQMLNFNIGAKHSLAAKIAGDNVIGNHIVALIHGLTYPIPVPVTKSSGIDGVEALDWTQAGRNKEGFPVTKGSAEDVSTNPIPVINADLATRIDAQNTAAGTPTTTLPVDAGVTTTVA